MSLGGPIVSSVTHIRYTENLVLTLDSLPFLTPLSNLVANPLTPPRSAAELLTDSCLSFKNLPTLLLQESLFDVSSEGELSVPSVLL